MFGRLRQSSNNGESHNNTSGGGGGYNNNNSSSYNSNSNSNGNNSNSNSYTSPNPGNNNSSSYNNSNNNSYDTYSSNSSNNTKNTTTSNNDSKTSANNNKVSSTNYQSNSFSSNENTRKEPSEAGQSTASSIFSSSNAGAQSNVSAATSVSNGYGRGSPKKPSYSQLNSKMDTIQDESNNTNTFASSNVNNNDSTANARRDTLYEDANEHVTTTNNNNRNQQNNESGNKSSNNNNIQSWQQTSAHGSTKGVTQTSNNVGSGRETSNSNNSANAAKTTTTTYSSSNNGKSINDSHGNNKNTSSINNQNSSYGSNNHDNHSHSNIGTNKPSSKNNPSGRSNSGKSASGRSNSGKGRNSPRQNEQHSGNKGATTYNSNGTAQHLDSHTRTSSNTGYGSSTTSHNSTGNKNSSSNNQDPIAQAGDFNDPNADVVFLSSESGSGPTRSPVVRFRIHSVNLRVHSPVLTKKVENETQKEHQLEEDSATLKHLFSLMYNRDSPILEPNDWQMVLRLARCAQKYDVVRAKERAIAYFTKNEQSGALSPFMTYAFAVQYSLPTLEAAAAERSVRYDVNKIPELIFNMMGFTAFQRLASFHAKRQEYYQDMLNALSIDPKEVADQCYQTGGVCVVTPLARLKQTLAWPRQVGRDATKRAPEPADVLRKIITEIGQIDCGTCAKALVEAGLAIQHTLENLPSYSHDDSN